MSDKKIDQQDFDTLQKIKEDYRNTITALGQMEAELAFLDNRKSHLKKNLLDTRIREEEFTKNLREKYGDVEIDTLTGEIKTK